jgi:predicted transcriptional regulator
MKRADKDCLVFRAPADLHEAVDHAAKLDCTTPSAVVRRCVARTLRQEGLYPAAADEVAA